MRATHSSVMVGLLAGCLSLPASAGWRAEVGRDPLSGAQRCLLRGDAVLMPDGYTDVHIEPVISGNALVLVTDSEIDASFGDLALTVDRRPPQPPPLAPSRIEGHSKVVFEPIGPLLDDFRAGAQLSVALRFWPGWPATGIVQAVFSLRGFTRAAEDFERCNSQPVPAAGSR